MQKRLVNWIDEGLPVAEPIVSWKISRIIVDETLAEATK